MPKFVYLQFESNYLETKMSSEDEFEPRDKPVIQGVRKSKRKQTFSKDNRDEHGSRLYRKRGTSFSEMVCPMCHLTLRPGDVQNHFEIELQKIRNNLCSLSPVSVSNLLQSISFGENREDQSSQTSSVKLPSSCHSNLSSEGGCSSSGSVARSEEQPGSSAAATSENGRLTSQCLPSYRKKKNLEFKEPGLESYKRVRVNRLLRLQCKRWQLKHFEDEATCPVCEEPVLAETPEELERHVDRCLRKQEGEASSSDEEIDVEGDEYEWCGMRKVRLTSLLKSQGQLDALGTRVQKGNEDGNVEVCLLQSEEQFGPPQYFESDLSCPFDDTTNSFEVDSNSTFTPDVVNNSDSKSEDVLSYCSAENSLPDERNASKGSVRVQNSVIEALQSKIQELEERARVICHICHGPYDVPLTSTVCWHVHCEKCWLQALSSQKLCPQCKVIVSPTELRRIYL